MKLESPRGEPNGCSRSQHEGIPLPFLRARCLLLEKRFYIPAARSVVSELLPGRGCHPSRLHFLYTLALSPLCRLSPLSFPAENRHTLILTTYQGVCVCPFANLSPRRDEGPGTVASLNTDTRLSFCWPLHPQFGATARSECVVGTTLPPSFPSCVSFLAFENSPQKMVRNKRAKRFGRNHCWSHRLPARCKMPSLVTLSGLIICFQH